MIQFWMKDQLAAAIPGILFTADYEPDAATYGTVFYEGGGSPADYDVKYRYPVYMVWVESTDWGLAEYVAQEVFDALHEWHERNNPREILVEYVNQANEVLGTDLVVLHKIRCAGEVNRIGVEDGKMQYSINFETTITEKE